jgi:mRNA interferase RelE/StbE
MSQRLLRVSHELRDQIRSLHPDLRRLVRAALDQILANPAVGKPLRGKLAGLRSLRVRRFRIIYRCEVVHIDLVAVGPRASIYETLERTR